MRRALAVDGEDRLQLHYELSAAMEIAVEMRSRKLAIALLKVASFAAPDLRSSAVGGVVGRAAALKLAPASMRSLSID